MKCLKPLFSIISGEEEPWFCSVFHSTQVHVRKITRRFSWDVEPWPADTVIRRTITIISSERQLSWRCDIMKAGMEVTHACKSQRSALRRGGTRRDGNVQTFWFSSVRTSDGGERRCRCKSAFTQVWIPTTGRAFPDGHTHMQSHTRPTFHCFSIPRSLNQTGALQRFFWIQNQPPQFILLTFLWRFYFFGLQVKLKLF